MKHSILLITALILMGCDSAPSTSVAGPGVPTNGEETCTCVGQEGPEGPAGTEGPEGSAGSAGPEGLPGMDGSQGPEGPAGLTGLQGSQGQQGVQGPGGPTGTTGPQGPTGAPGAQGAAGQEGPAGTAGVDGVLSSKGDVYTVISNAVAVGAPDNVVITASCDDSNDILLSGFCGHPAAGATWKLTENRAWNADNNQVALWTCTAWNNAGGAAGGFVHAGAICINVP